MGPRPGYLGSHPTYLYCQWPRVISISTWERTLRIRIYTLPRPRACPVHVHVHVHVETFVTFDFTSLSLQT